MSRSCSLRPDSCGLLADRTGAGLVEVLVAAVILVVVMFWLTLYYVEGRKHIDYEEQRRKATALAQARLDQARTWSYDYLSGLAGPAGLDTLMTVEGRNYTVKLSVTDGPNAHCRTVTAVVEWQAALDYDSRNAFMRSDTTVTVIGRRL